ncbi:MAG: DUF6231 family protein [Pseudomonadota bacterium]
MTAACPPVSLPELLGLSGPLTVVTYGDIPDTVAVTGASKGDAAAAVPATADLALVGPIAGASSDALEHLLGRLINYQVRLIVLFNSALAEPLPASRLRALNFVPMEALQGACAYDATLANQRREWNDSTNWANPEQFRRRF